MLAKLLMTDGRSVNEQTLEQLSQVVGSISIEGGIVHELMAKVLTCAVNMIDRSVVKENSSNKILGHDMTLLSLRRAAESEYRKAAHYAEAREEKIFWVDLANSVRPVTLI
jgi:hypothetical protein